MKYYGVNLYLKSDDCMGFEKIGKVIVRTSLLYDAKEICTNRKIKTFTYDSFLILVDPGEVFILADDIEKKNLVSLTDVKKYISSYKNEKCKSSIYCDNISSFHGGKQKVREINKYLRSRG